MSVKVVDVIGHRVLLQRGRCIRTTCSCVVHPATTATLSINTLIYSPLLSRNNLGLVATHNCSDFSRLLPRACSSKDPGLLAVARGCPKLEKLMLTGCGSITGKSVRALARGCVSLRDLSLSGCGGVGNGDLRELAKGCKGLRHLNIAECAQVRVVGLPNLRGIRQVKMATGMLHSTLWLTRTLSSSSHRPYTS